MKNKRLLSLVVLVVVMTLAILSLVACGDKGEPTEVYTKFWNYIEAKGGSLKYLNLTNSDFKKISVYFDTMSDRIFIYMYWQDTNMSHYISYSIYKDSTKPVRVSYSETYGTTKVECVANCSDLTKSSSVDVQKVTQKQNDKETELQSTAQMYQEIVKMTKSYIEKTIVWIDATLQVELNDYSLTVNNLYQAK